MGVLDRKKRVLTYAPLHSNALVRLETRLHTASTPVDQKIESVLHASPAEKREAHNRCLPSVCRNYSACLLQGANCISYHITQIP